ncbi:MAG TPA: SDR family oxidoreductase [Solirubrobacteraceae bacterium]|nr:SDR family oxidoreductase [Solirubrobacteraceae bacterium]
MDVVVAGGHGKVALRLERLLAAGGHRARGIVRNGAHAADLEALGAEAVVLDLERAAVEDAAAVLEGADAAVFAAGAGPGSGPERKRTVDLGAAVKLLEACGRAGVRRYVVVSSIGAHDPASGGPQMRPYLEAKAEADRAVMAGGLDWTIVRPGGLTDDPGTGRVRIETEMGHRGRVPRDDVAATLLAVLETPATIGMAFELFAGDTPIAEALARL